MIFTRSRDVRGRKGFDSVGWVVAQAPETSWRTLKLEEKAKQTGKGH